MLNVILALIGSFPKILAIAFPILSACLRACARAGVCVCVCVWLFCVCVCVYWCGGPRNCLYHFLRCNLYWLGTYVIFQFNYGPLEYCERFEWLDWLDQKMCSASVTRWGCEGVDPFSDRAEQPAEGFSGNWWVEGHIGAARTKVLSNETSLCSAMYQTWFVKFDQACSQPAEMLQMQDTFKLLTCV